MKIDLPLLGSEQHRRPRIVGIDLGTTNSLAAAMIDGEPHILASPDGHRMTPSVVAFPPGQPPVVGRSAVAWLHRDPSRVVYSVKRLMGRGPSDVAEERARASYVIEDGPGEVVRVRMDERRLTPPEISALILSELKSQAEAALGEEVAQAVVTVPAYFNDSQRQATRDAGRIAGLDVLRIVNEPTAACLAYGLQRKREGLAAIYDLGGGTFDISILKLTGGVFEVLATRGDTQLGGDDFDRLLVELLLDEKWSTPGAKPAGPPPEQLRLAAEQARRLLSVQDRAVVEFDGLRREITRSEFESLAAPLVERTLDACRGALADAGLSASQIEDVVLVGGATRTPLVRREVEVLFGRTPHSDLNPDEVVALGAAVQAGILAGDVEDLLLLDVIPLSLGIETYGGVVEKLIPRNSTIPVAARQTFTTNVDGQSAIGIHVLQGEREMAADNRSLARFNVEIDPMPAGWPRLEVNFLVDENGILQVRAYEERSESEATIEVRPSYGLTDDEVEEMIISSFDHAESDLRRRLLIEARVEAEQTLNATLKQMPDAREFAQAGLLPQDELQRIEEAVEALDEALGGDDYRTIRSLASSLDRVTQGLAALVVDREVSRALSGRELQSVVRETSGDTSN